VAKWNPPYRLVTIAGLREMTLTMAIDAFKITGEARKRLMAQRR
jgi:hypothetical protein